ncbi:MAG: tetratricopeptide repeat protein [Cyanobacteriota bacterium]|nr:tetratricopeptide repeat protein [Cyanobacteriota bacterium]
MPKFSYGPVPESRVRQLFEKLLDYAEGHLDYGIVQAKLKTDWQDGDYLRLAVETTLEDLRVLLYDKEKVPEKVRKRQRYEIGTLLTHYLGEFLEIWEDRRVQKRGSRKWIFSLKLWSRDKEVNLQQFDEEWRKRQPENSTSRPTVSLQSEMTEKEQPIAKRLVGFETMPSVPMWFGRDKLLGKLAAKMLPPPEDASPTDTGPKVLAIVGQGGIGKTALGIKLLSALGAPLPAVAPQNNSFFDVYLFYRVREGSSFDDFAAFLLGGLGLSADNLPTAEEKIAAILGGLMKRRCLLLLDNLESILHPARHPQGGKAVSPDWRRLLHDLVYCNHRSRGILTSRELPLDLADPRSRRREPDPKLVLVEALGGVADGDGVRILREYGLTDREEDLRSVAARVKGNVLLLGQLAAIARDFPGYLGEHPELVTEEAEPIIRQQLERQSEAGRELLRRMSVLRVGVVCRELTFLRLYTGDEEKDERLLVAAGLGEPVEFSREEVRETEAIVNSLVSCSLVQKGYDSEKCEFFYDLHRLIREFLLAESASQMERLQRGAYLFYLSCPDADNPQSLEDLRPALEAQYFAFSLGEYQKAEDLIMYRLEDYLKPWGHWSLLKDLYDEILPHVAEGDKSWWLLVIGCIYREWGDWDLAERYFLDALSRAREGDSKSGIATSLEMLGDIQRNRGNWDAAEKLYQDSLELRKELGDRPGMAATYASLGDIQRLRGN